MKTRLIYILFFSFCLAAAQKKNDTLKLKNKFRPQITVGVDVLNASLSVFSDRKMFQGYVSSKIKNNWYGILDLGYDKNVYQKGGYNATASGAFGKVGAYTMLSRDAKDQESGFYAGGKLGATFYTQEYYTVPIRAYGGSDVYMVLPASSQSAYWVEGFVGAKVRLFSSSFYVDVNAQPKFLAYTSKQEEMVPMIIPGFGKSSNKFNIGFSWNIAYQF